MVRALRELEMNTVVQIGKFYAYEYNGELHVGEAVKKKGRVANDWVMRNLNTGKIEYPYSQQVFVTEEPCKSVKLTYEVE